LGGAARPAAPAADGPRRLRRRAALVARLLELGRQVVLLARAAPRHRQRGVRRPRRGGRGGAPGAGRAGPPAAVPPAPPPRRPTPTAPRSSRARPAGRPTASPAPGWP